MASTIVPPRARRKGTATLWHSARARGRLTARCPDAPSNARPGGCQLARRSRSDEVDLRLLTLAEAATTNGRQHREDLWGHDDGHNRESTIGEARDAAGAL